MIQEDYVNFECAKLLKEKGFPQELGEKGCVNTIPYYTQNGGFVTCDLNTIRQRWYPKAAAPTLQMAMKWLREIHHLHITVFSSSQESWMYRITKPHQTLEEGRYGEDYISYEEAVQAAIMYCLNNLI